MNVLVTGSRGYIGSVLCDYLAKKGHKVTGYDIGYFEGKDFVPRKHNSNVISIKKDIRHMDENDLKGIDAIVHLAGLSNDPAGDLNPELTSKINCAASVRLATLAREAGVPRFLFASSCSIYGAADPTKFMDERSPVAPLTPYAESKVDAETYLSLLANEKFSPVYLRSATAYGVSPRMRFDLVVNDLTATAFTSGKVLLKSKGDAWRPIVHVNDIARAYEFLLKQPRENVHDQAFNLVSQNVKVKDIAYLVSNEFDRIPVTFGESSDARTYRVGADKLKSIGLEPERNLMPEISRMRNLFQAVGLNKNMYEDEYFWTVKRMKSLREDGILDGEFYRTPGAGIDGHLKSWVRT